MLLIQIIAVINNILRAFSVNFTFSCTYLQEENLIIHNAAAMTVSYHVALKIAKTARTFRDAEFVKECFVAAATILCPANVPVFETVPLSRRTVCRRIEEMANDVEAQLRNRIKDLVFFSLALDESTDVCDVAQLAVFLRGVDAQFNVIEELLDLVPMHYTTTANDIFSSLENVIEKYDLRWEKLSSIATDGAPAMVGHKSGVVALVRQKLKEVGVQQEIPAIHCVLHRVNLLAKCVKLVGVMDVVIKTVNILRSHGLGHRQFKSFLADLECEYGDVPYFCEVRWLSRGAVLERFFNLRKDIALFMDAKGKPVKELDDSQWILDLAFLTDLTKHLNSLNLALQGRNKVISEVVDTVVAFKRKFLLWAKQLEMSCVHYRALH